MSINKYKYIGVTGFSQSGKDETVKILNLLGYTKISLAEPVRQGIYNINPIIVIDDKFKYLINNSLSSINNTSSFYQLKDIVDLLGWDEAKKIPEVRRLLQFYGTEGGRKIFGDTIWMDLADTRINEEKIKLIAISDIRFENEVEWLRKKENNFLIKIKRPNIGPINSHSSDFGINDTKCDLVINNDGTLSDLKDNILNFFK